MEYVQGENRYGRYCIPAESRHRPAAQAILAGDVWEPETTAFIAQQSRYGDVVTGGAYFGDMLPAAANGGTTVYAAEPNPVNFAAAKLTLEANGIENVKLVHAGFGVKPGLAVIEVADRFGTPHGGGSWITSQLRIGRRGAERVSCSLVAIDDLVPTDHQVALVHLDVEGFESQALRGALQTIERCLPDLLLERRPRYGRAAGRLASLGYRVVAEMDGNTLLSTKRISTARTSFLIRSSQRRSGSSSDGSVSTMRSVISKPCSLRIEFT
jgi:FkbM family methyltransferase